MHYVDLPDYLSDMTGYTISIYIWTGSTFPYKKCTFFGYTYESQHINQISNGIEYDGHHLRSSHAFQI